MRRYFVILAGVACVVVAVVSFPIPGVPWSAFLLFGAAMLARSSPALEQRLREHRLLGPWIRRIEELPPQRLLLVLIVWLAVLLITGGATIWLMP